jgi:hypothetical protein
VAESLSEWNGDQIIGEGMGIGGNSSREAAGEKKLGLRAGN